jgi:enoyl-CoA hydratase
MSVVEFEVRSHTAWITLNRPERKNTLIAESFSVLGDAWAEVRRDQAIRVAVLTAAGEDDFCCGGDIDELIAPRYDHSDDPRADDARSDGYRRALLLDEPLDKPIIAAVNGRALGGGTELLGATDVRIASEHATFALPEVKLGIVPGAGSMVRLARQVPWAHAMRIMLTGDIIDAPTALSWGLISEIVPATRLRDRAEELAERIAANAPLAVQAVKRTARQTHTLPWDEAFELEYEATSAMSGTEDAAEGPAAFLEKRAPRFQGR